MNAKVKKIVQLTAGVLFLIALVINIKVTLEDPFSMVSKDALAQTAGGGSGNDGSGTDNGTGGGGTEDDGGTGGTATDGCTMSQSCSGGICSILHAKKRTLANGCKKNCNYTCTVQGLPDWPL